jgi:hypothetical protein
MLQTDMWKVVYLNGRKMVSIPLAKTGDSDRKQILSEWTHGPPTGRRPGPHRQ